jgi:hypothetical protein
MPEGTPGKPPTLEYAPRVGLAWIGRHRKWLILLALCFAVAAPTWWYWQSLKARAMWLYWSHRAAVHVMPINAEISIIGREASRLATTNPDYVPYSPFKPVASTQPSASYNPIAFRELAKLDGRLRSMGYPDGPVIFMGTVHRPDGKPRLVIITGGSERDCRYMLRNVGAAVLPLPRWFDPLPPASGTPLLRFGGGSGGPPEPAAYLSGMIDPRDPSHVVIPYVVSESTTAIIRRMSAAARANTPGAPIGPVSAAIIRSVRDQTPLVIGQGEIDVHLQNDDSLSFAIRGPGQLAAATIAGDPQSLLQASQASQAQHVARGGAPSPTTGRGSWSRGRSGGE